MIKRCFVFLFLAVSLLVMLPFSAHADVLVEPNNDFYSRHRNEMTSLNRSFYANGESGSVSLKKAPDSKSEVTVIKNGEVLNIMFTYNHKGEAWGVTELYMQDVPYGQWPTGWIPMNQLLLVYDFISFAEEHKDEFYPYAGSYEALKTAQEIVLWSWPGSGNTPKLLHATPREAISSDESFSFSHAYKDDQGREWGFIGYWYGYRNVWVCISDPANSGIPAFNPAPQPQLWQPSDASAPKNVFPMSLLIIILVVVLVVGTAVLIRVFWRPNKNVS